MDFELFYEEIEGFGLVYAFERFDNFWKLFKSRNQTR
jgi:hypothetical protein